MKTYTAKDIKEELTKVMKSDSPLYTKIVNHFSETTIEEEAKEFLGKTFYYRAQNKIRFEHTKLGTKHLILNSFKDNLAINTQAFLEQYKISDARTAFAHGYIAGLGLTGVGLLGEKELE